MYHCNGLFRFAVTPLRFDFVGLMRLCNTVTQINITPFAFAVGLIMRLCFRWVVRAWFTPFLFLFKASPVRSTKGVGACITCFKL